MWTLGFGCVGVRLWLYRLWILVERVLDCGCLEDIILIVWKLDFG